MEWRDLPPGRAIPQAPVDPALALSRSRDGQAVWAGCRGRAGTELQHFAAIRGGRIAQAVTALTIHDIVISPRFPSSIFYGKAFRFQHKRCSLAGPIDENCLISEGA
jgi:hypothetical protein